MHIIDDVIVERNFTPACRLLRVWQPLYNIIFVANQVDAFKVSIGYNTKVRQFSDLLTKRVAGGQQQLNCQDRVL